jgi:predicted N-acetyltransferase YhbS
MHIDYLGAHVELVPQIAAWEFEEWGGLVPGDTVEKRLERLKGRLNVNEVPMTLIALSGTVPVGTVAVVESDLPGREDLGPWLANLLVPQELRRQGIGSALARRAIVVAAELGHDDLFLFAWEHHDFYQALGWETFDVAEYAGREVSLMRIATGSPAGG